jgi:PAS domain S-box-containing protein
VVTRAGPLPRAPAGAAGRGARPAAPAEGPDLAPLYAERRYAIARSWTGALAQSGYIALSARELRQQVAALTDEAIQVLLGEVFDITAARAIGVGLARVGYTHPQVLGRTLQVLGQQLVAAVPPAAALDLQPRLAALLGELATGFAAESRTSILHEQEAIHQALVVERDHAELALRESESRFRAIFEGAPFGIAVAEMNGKIITVNPALETVLGYSAAEMHGRVILAELVHPDDGAAGYAAFVGLAAGHYDRYAIEQRFYRKGGEEMWVRLAMSLVRDADGQPQFAIGIGEDITERRRADDDRKHFEAALEAARDAAEGANRAKSEFLANMSHEIRTPMNAILGIADVLAETSLNPEQQEYVALFRRAGDALLSLINDILDLSKVEAGQLELETTEFDPAELVEGVAEMLAPRAHAKGLELTCEVAPDVPGRVRGDPQRLRQVLLNLVGNAVKFTARGEVHLGLACEVAASSPESGGPPLTALRFTVQDTGIGIPPEQLAAVFGAFTQADASTTRRYGGTGLGLHIVERLVSLMGGRVTAESVLGQGATFAITVPLEAEAGGPAPAPAAAELAGARVLVADDSATNRLILRRLLEGRGVEVTEAAGGEAALVALLAGRAAGKTYDLLLLDQRMPDLEGFEVLARLGAAGAAGPAAPAAAQAVLMLSSDQRMGDAERARALGVARYLVKPVKRAALLAAVEAALGHGGAGPGDAPALPPAAPAGSEDGAPARPQRLLLVDDSEDNRRLVQLYLKAMPYVLDTAGNGREGLTAFRHGHYDLVLMDVHMPVMDGLEATRAIRAWEGERGHPPTPVVALTASAMAEDVRQTLAAGCDVHLAKPVKKQALLETIARYARAGDVAGA